MKRTPLKAGSGLQRTTSLARSSRLRTVPGVTEVKSAAARRSRPGAGEFSPEVKLQCRTRAGNGCADDARCECCGCFLGRYGGQVQHRLARGIGGSKDPLVRSLANAALLCGTSVTPSCHGDAESRDPERDMEAKGFVIRHGTGPDFDPRYVPVMLASPFGSRQMAWLSADGPEYLFQRPELELAS